MSVRTLAFRPASRATSASRPLAGTGRRPASSTSGHRLADIPIHRPGQVIQANGLLAAAAAAATGPVGIGLGVLGLGLGGVALYRHWTRDRRTHQDLAQRLGTLEAYQHEAGEGAEGRLAAQYQRLHQIEQEAHTWLRDRNPAASETDRTSMFALIDRINTHRQALVGHTLAGNHGLWLPAEVGHGEAVRARGIWHSVRQNQGNIQIHGGGAFRTRVLADTSKLLQSRHGRDMLEELDANQGGDASRQIRIGANWDGVYDANEPGSWARPIADNPQAFSPAHGAQGLGAGSHVQIGDGAEGGRLAGPRLEPIHQPSYITLGHELGHARRSLAGRGRSGPVWDRPTDPTHANGRRQAIERQLWRNSPEEFENITTEENRLRANLGLPERRYHRAHSAVRLTLQRHALSERFERARAGLGDAAEDLAAHREAEQWANGWPVGELDWNHPEGPQRAETSIAAFERQVSAVHLRRRARQAGIGLAALGGLALAGGAAYLGWGRR